MVAAFFVVFGAALAVAFAAGLAAALVVVAAFFGAALVVFAAGALAAVLAGATSAVAALASAAALAAAASARAVLLSAARALPAAVWAPFALPALPAAMRALAALAAAALPVVLTTRPPVWTCSPPSAALTLRVRRDLRRAAAFGMDGADLGGPVERAQRLGQRGHGVDRRTGGLRGGAQGLGDVGLGGAPAGLQDLVAALCLTDPLESGRRPCAGPGAGRLGQVGEPRTVWESRSTRGAERCPGREGGWYHRLAAGSAAARDRSRVASRGPGGRPGRCAPSPPS